MEKRRKHTAEYKKEAVRLMMSREDRPVRVVAEELGVPEAQLCAWRKRYGAGAGALGAEHDQGLSARGTEGG